MKAHSLFLLLSATLLPFSAQAALTVFGDDFEYAGVPEDDFAAGSLTPWTAVGAALTGTFNPSGAASTTNGWYDGITAFTDTEPSGGAVGDMAGPEAGFIFNGGSGAGIQRDIGTIEANTLYQASIAISGDRQNSEVPETYSIDLLSGSTVLDTISEPSAGLLFENRVVSFDSTSLPGGVNVGDNLTFRITVAGTADYLDFDNLVISETLVPEPSAAILLGLSGLGLLLRRRRD